MATSVMPLDAATADVDVMRVPPVMIDLIPPEITATRRGRRARRLVLSALAGFTGLLLAWYGLASYQTSSARDHLASTTTEALKIQREQQKYNEVVSVQNESAMITKQLATLVATDVSWSRLLLALRRAAPPGVRVSGITASLTTGDNVDGGPAEGLPNTTGEEFVGRLMVTGNGDSKALVADYLESVATVDGLANPLLGAATEQSGKVQFTVQLDITAAAIQGGRHVPAQPPTPTSTNTPAGG